MYDGRMSRRLQSIDVVRGLVMVVMAIDHARDYLGNAHFDPMDPGRTTAALYLTRLVTHLCAPGFILLAGTSAYLARKGPRFLLSRGLWLVVVEITIVAFGWTFNPAYGSALQVIWAIGWSMVALAAIVLLPPRAILVLALAMIGLHNLFDGIPVAALRGGGGSARDWAISILHVQNFPVIYPLVPWIGVMALGYAIGPVFEREDRVRRLLVIGLCATAAFVALRLVNRYGDPHPWTTDHPLMSFFRTEKYPPSLDYLLMTLGPIFLLLAAAEKVPVPALVVFGRVPFFFYITHIYAIHALAVLVAVSTGFGARTVLAPWPQFPESFGLPLAAMYLAWALVVAALYPACSWYARLKSARRDVWWLSYI